MALPCTSKRLVKRLPSVFVLCTIRMFISCVLPVSKHSNLFILLNMKESEWYTKIDSCFPCQVALTEKKTFMEQKMARIVRIMHLSFVLDRMEPI